MAALDEMARRDAEVVRERLARRLAEKQAESEASYEQVQRLARGYKAPPISPNERELIRSGKCPLRKQPRAPDRGLDLATDGPWHDSLGTYYGVEELDFG